MRKKLIHLKYIRLIITTRTTVAFNDSLIALSDKMIIYDKCV